MAKSVVVVGGGAVGLCTALYLLRSGCDVTVIQKQQQNAHICSWGNAGFITPSHFVPLAAPGMVGMGLRMLLAPQSPFTIHPRLDIDLFRWALLFNRACTAARAERAMPILRDLNLESRSLYLQLAAEWGNPFDLVTTGLLMLCRTHAALDEEAHMAHQANTLGLSAEILNRRETAAMDPNVEMHVAGSVYYSQDCFLNPTRLLAELQNRVVESGGIICWGCEVIGWRREERSIYAAVTSHGELEADEFVMAAGMWSGACAADLDLKLPMQAGKGYSITVANPPAVPHVCSILSGARVAVTPLGSGVRFGGTMEITGSDVSINQSRVEGIFSSIPKFMPQFRFDDLRKEEVWAGLRPCSPDGLPYIGRTGRYRNLIVASGHAMMGISLAPVTGKLVAGLVTGQPAFLSLLALSPDRYA